MPVPPIPVNRYLVPPVQPTVPEGFNSVSQALTTGLPHTISLNDDLSLVLIVPNGLAHTWRDGDPSMVISQSSSEIAPHVGRPSEDLGSASRPPARLLLRRTGSTIASVPLVAGLSRFIPDSGSAPNGIALELIIIGWKLHSGLLRGAGDFGSRIELAWREAGQGVDFYSELPEIPPFLFRLRDVIILPTLFPRTLQHDHFRNRILRAPQLKSSQLRIRT